MTDCPIRPGRDSQRHHAGVILLITLVILVILATLGYTLSVQVAARRHRDQYMIDYGIARHACASGVKYALAAMGSLQFPLVSRPNEPDFSDVFALSEPEYQKLLAQAAALRAADSNLVPEEDLTGTTTKENAKSKTGKLRGPGDVNDVNSVDPNEESSMLSEPVAIRGPYGPPWPLVTEPMEFEIGSAKVKIEIEDENAKYPLGWAILADEKLQAKAAVGWTTFCEWMGYKSAEVDALNVGLARIAKVKPFKTEFKPETEAVEPPAAIRSRITRPTPSTSTALRRTVTRKPVSVEDQITRQNKEFAKLVHSSLIDKDLLSRPSIESDTRQECALKYLGLWATRHVNVNTAPRHVLEAAMAFGSVADAPKIAEGIIRYRQNKPVADVNELKQAVPRYSTAIDDCRTFITATSTVFTVRVTAFSGVARAAALVAVSKEGDKVQPIAVISE